MNKKELGQLIDKYLQGNATLEEKELLESLFDSFQPGMQWDEELLGERQQVEDKMLQRLQQSLVKPEIDRQYKVILLFPFKRAAAAVIFLTLISTAIYYGLKKAPAQQPIVKNKVQVKHDVEPGSNKAILILNDGSKLELNSAKNGILVKKGNISVKKEQDGKLVYVVAGGKALSTEAEIAYNTISTPVGGQYQVILPDGTKVWLDAASSLKFPTAFTGNQRNVELTGEAYFEVTKNAAMPFNVKVNNMQVKVLGTHFNIMAYTTETAIKTTLLEGSVQLTSANEKNVLKPGQQGVVSRGGNIKVYDVDTDMAVAWKNGFFQFDRSNIQDIMNQLSRWYDTKVTYEGKVPDDEFVGKITRSAKLSQVLHILELSHVHFRIEDKNIIVMP